MTMIDKIRAEIERRKLLLEQRSKLIYDLILETFVKEYDDLLAFINSLPEEKPSDVELEKKVEGEVILNGHALLLDVTRWADGYKLKVIIKED